MPLLGLCVVALLGIFPLTAQAFRTVTVGQPLVVRLELNQPTTIILPEGIAKTIAGYDEKTLEIKSNGPYVSLIARLPDLAGRLQLIGVGGTFYYGTFKTGSVSDDVLYVVHPTPTAAATVPFSPEGLLRSLRWPHTNSLPGAQAVSIPAPKPPDARLTVVDAISVRTGTLHGMTLTVRNMEATPLILDLRIGASSLQAHDLIPLGTFTWPPPWEVALVTADSETIQPGSETRIYLVLQRKEGHVIR